MEKEMVGLLCSDGARLQMCGVCCKMAEGVRDHSLTSSVVDESDSECEDV